jgi:uncharacterized tellurite resistance protein B-like protein
MATATATMPSSNRTTEPKAAKRATLQFPGTRGLLSEPPEGKIPRAMNADQARRVCQLVAGIVVTDEDLDPSEEAFVGRMLKKFGMDESEREVIFPLVDGEEAALAIRDLPQDTQQEAFALLIEAAAADGKIAPEERDYLAKVAEAIGIASEEIDKRLNAALRG